MQKQLLLLLLTFLALFCAEAEAANPYIHARDTRTVGKGTALHQTVRTAPLNHHLNARQNKGQVNRYTHNQNARTAPLNYQLNTRSGKGQADRYTGKRKTGAL